MSLAIAGMRIAALALICLLSPVGSSAAMGKKVVVVSQNDREFSEIIAAIANRRKTNRSTAIIVTELFQPMTERLSLTELRNYISSRYSVRREVAQGEKYEWVDLEKYDLKVYSKEFFYLDSVRIVFFFDPGWESVIKFQAVLFNDQL